jgi:RNA polymerase sigma-70 factor (ECF subfamily)
MSDIDFLENLKKFEPILKAECHKHEISGMEWEDLAQEVRLKLYLKKDTFRGESSFKTWANRVMINCIIDLERTSKTKKASHLNEADDLDRIKEEEFDF